MTATYHLTEPGPPDANGSSAAARWMSGLGAFLLIAAAATFVAVRWEEIPDEAKFGALLALTVGCVGADRWLRPRLPITASAIFHIGVLLVPIDVAAVGVWLGWEWPEMLLAQGIAVTTACGTGARTRQSVVLLTATWFGVVALAGGVGAMTGVPSGVMLATIALLAAMDASIGRTSTAWRGKEIDYAAAAWATVAGLAVPLAAAERIDLPGVGVLADVGLATPSPHPAAALTGAVSAVALFLVAHRWRSVPVALVGVASLLTGAATTWVGTEPGVEASLVAVAALLLLAEVVAWALRRDPFWAAPANLVARSGEVVAAVLTVYAAGVVGTAPAMSGPYPTAALAASLVSLTWLACLARTDRPDARWYWPWTSAPVGLRGALPLAAAAAGAAAGVLLTDDLGARAAVLVVPGGAATLVAPTALPGAAVNRVLAAGLLIWAPVVAYDEPALAASLGLIGAVVLAFATVDTARYSGTKGFNSLAYTLAALSLAPLAAGWLVALTQNTQEQAALSTGGAIVGAWLVAVMLDQAAIVPAPRVAQAVQVSYTEELAPPALPLPLAMVARLGALVPLAAVPLAGDALFTAPEALLVAGLFAALAMVDVGRLDDPKLLVGVGCATPIALASAVFMAGGTLEQASVALIMSALVWLGISAALPDRWAVPAALSGTIAGVAGFLVGSEDPGATSVNLLMFGVGLLMVGIATDDLRWLAAGCGTTTVGFWWQLGLHEVTWSEPYVAPAALALWVVGYATRRGESSRGTSADTQLLHPRRRPGGTGTIVSTWLAYAPAVALLGGAALLERLTDGSSGWHGVIAGAVGIAAVAVGGLWRQAGPLFTGTALVVAITAHETLDASAQVPTWAWLAAGGATLLGLGILLERRGTGPLETGRRLVDIVSERFS